MVASQHWRRKVIRGCLKAWLTYIGWRRVKHQMRGVASEHHNLVVTMKTFSCWKRRHLRARQLADFHELVSVKGKLATLRRAVWQWKFCTLYNNNITWTLVCLCLLCEWPWLQLTRYKVGTTQAISQGSGIPVVQSDDQIKSALCFKSICEYSTETGSQQPPSTTVSCQTGVKIIYAQCRETL